METATKAPHFKSRNGCLRCKSKKTKCDEKKPSCARCEDRGFQCPGYALNVRWSQKHQSQVDKLAAKAPTPNSQQESVSVTERDAEDVVVTPCITPASEDLQQLDSWLTPASQWDMMMPQDLFGLDEVIHNPEASVASSNPTFWASSMDPVWCAEGVSAIPLFSAEGQQTGQKRPADDDSNALAIIDQGPKQRPRFEDSLEPRITELDSNLLSDSLNPFLNPPQELFNLPTALSEYFFREVITLYCTWDSKSNAMRNIVESKWQSSGVLHHTIQSMAAACLSEDFPRLSSVAKREHHQALQYIKGKSPSPGLKEDVLLAYMLLGHTASWIHPQNLATEMFRASCGMLNDVATKPDDSDHLAFFNDTMDYWAMLLVYLTDSQHLGDYRRDSSQGPTDPAKAIEPHPYSGISRETVKMLTDTGILIFKYRKHMAGVKFMTEKDLDVFRVALREARRLERSLLAHCAPDASQIKDPGDPKTPLNHLQLIDEAYRCTGLLQIYRVFPDLLNERYAPWNKERILRPPPATKIPTAQERQTWLTKLAMHILNILRDIPFESRTRSAQPFIMVAVSSELRRDSQHAQNSDSSQDETGSIFIDQASIEVVRARKFVGSRLAAYTHILPLRKIRVIFELINCVWSALDSGEQDVYWLDIAYEKNLGTLMG